MEMQFENSFKNVQNFFKCYFYNHLARSHSKIKFYISKRFLPLDWIAYSFIIEL